ncbi:MAG: hypothetical protein AAF125_18965 [Chloroflexota bacterium]
MKQQQRKQLTRALYGVAAMLGAMILAVPLTSPTDAQAVSQGGVRLTQAAEQAANLQATAQAAGVQETAQAAQANAQATADVVRANAEQTAQAVQGNAQATADVVRDNAQATATIVSGNVAATADVVRNNAEATAQAVQTLAWATAQSAQGNAEATAQVIQTQIAATVEVRATEVAATVEALQTQVAATLQANLQAIDDQFEAIDVAIDPETGTARVTSTINENQVTESLNVALATAGYTTTVFVDMVPDGVIVTLNDAPTDFGNTADIVVELVLVETDTGYDFVIIETTINGIPVSSEGYDEVLLAYVESFLDGLVDGSISDFAEQLPEGNGYVSSDVEDVTITDSAFIVLVVATAG